MSMAEADGDAAWAAISKGVFMGMLVEELTYLCDQIVKGCDQAFGRAEPPTAGTNYFRSDPEAITILERVVSDAARAKALIEHRQKGKKQHAGEYVVQEARASWFQEVFAGIELAPLLTSQLRNSIEHFDEYVIGLAYDDHRGRVPPATFYPTNWLFGSKEWRGYDLDLPDNMVPVRVYFVAERAFVNCGREADIGGIADAARQMLDRLKLVVDVERGLPVSSLILPPSAVWQPRGAG